MLTLTLAMMLQAAAPVAVLRPDETLLEVQAEGEATYAPDSAYLSVGVVSTGTTAREATDGNARTMAEVVAAVKKAGVEARHVRTQQISVQPRFARMTGDDYQGQARITGYVANNSVAVTVTKLDRAPDVVAAAFGAGANSVNGPNLSSQDPAKGQSEAREQAITNAREEAEAYARSLGLRIARVLRVSERGNTAQPMIYATAARIAAPAPPPPPPIEAGEMQRRVTVWVDFALSK